MNAPAPTSTSGSSSWAIFLAFLRLGLTSFGGPVAHLGYFRNEFVGRRQWLSDASFIDIVALCQFLPGPSSSQVGIAIGLLRGGWVGSIAAWLGFTMPSALLMIAFGYGISSLAAVGQSGAGHGLKVVAVAVVAQAVWGMAKTLCADRPRAMLAIACALMTLALPNALGQIGAILVSALAGMWFLTAADTSPSDQQLTSASRFAGGISLGVFVTLMAGVFVWQGTGATLPALLAGFWRTGALVFGGGHVVLPLLQSVVVPSGAIGNPDFLAGYGAAQAVPGPLFTFAAYLGTAMSTPLHGWLGGLVFLGAIFAPGYLLVVGVLPFWDDLRRYALVRAAMAGVNAGVVGILLSALYDPVWTTAIHSRADFGLALAAFGLLLYARASPLAVVMFTSVGGWLLPQA